MLNILPIKYECLKCAVGTLDLMLAYEMIDATLLHQYILWPLHGPGY